MKRAPVAPSLNSPTVRANIRAAEQRRARLRSPAAKRRRIRSRTLYRSVGAPEAASIDHGTFAATFDSPPYRGLTLRPGERVNKYAGDHSAIVDLADGKRGVAESVLPLLTTAPGGGKRPVDLSLHDRGKALEPAAPLVSANLAQEARHGFSLPDIGIDVQPAAASASSGSVIEDKVFYPNVLPDADLLVRPMPYGVETDSILRSPSSPEDIGFSLTLPTRAELRLVPGPSGFPAGAAVSRDGKDLLVVPPAVAYDADGRGIPVSYSVDGSDLTLHVPHRTGGYRYRHWHVHPGAVGKFQGFSNSGMISRISLQQVRDTCSGA